MAELTLNLDERAANLIGAGPQLANMRANDVGIATGWPKSGVPVPSASNVCAESTRTAAILTAFGRFPPDLAEVDKILGDFD